MENKKNFIVIYCEPTYHFMCSLENDFETFSTGNGWSNLEIREISKLSVNQFCAVGDNSVFILRNK